MTTTSLAGTRSYEIRFLAGDLPPHRTDGYCSITLYNAAGFLVANPIGRYSIGDQTPGLVEGADGSLTIAILSAADLPSTDEPIRSARSHPGTPVALRHDRWPRPPREIRLGACYDVWPSISSRAPDRAL
jgi:hypothetical protein